MKNITIRSTKTLDGTVVRYARIRTQVGATTIGQSVLLCRLSADQRKLAGLE